MGSSKKGVYISFTHFRKPLPESKQVQVTESCDIIDKVNNHHERSATAIIDVLGKCFYKNRTPDISYDRMMYHFAQTYPRQKEAMDLYLKENGHAAVEMVESTSGPVGLGATEPSDVEQPKKKSRKKKESDETQTDTN